MAAVGLAVGPVLWVCPGSGGIPYIPLWEAAELEMCLERNADQRLGLPGRTAMER